MASRQKNTQLSLIDVHRQLVPTDQMAPASSGTEQSDIAIGSQAEIRCYRRERGDVVLLQSDWPDDDAVILIQPENVPKLVLRLLAVAGFGDLQLVRHLGGNSFEDFEVEAFEGKRPCDRNGGRHD